MGACGLEEHLNWDERHPIERLSVGVFRRRGDHEAKGCDARREKVAARAEG
jgi:hypothetical protein